MYDNEENSDSIVMGTHHSDQEITVNTKRDKPCHPQAHLGMRKCGDKTLPSENFRKAISKRNAPIS